MEHGDGPTQRVERAEYADAEAKASPKGRWRGVCARVVVSYGPTCTRNLVLQRKGDAAFVEGFNRRTTIARRRCIKFLRERRKRMENVFKADDITVERCFFEGGPRPADRKARLLELDARGHKGSKGLYKKLLEEPQAYCMHAVECASMMPCVALGP